MYKKMQLIEYITQDIIAYIMEEKQTDMADAMHEFYTSETYEKLNDEGTGLYLEGSAYIYDLFQNEYRNGRIIQEEV